MSFKTTPAPVAKERSRTVYTNNISFKTTPAPGAKQRSRTVYTRKYSVQATPAPGAKQRSRTVTSGCLVQNGIGSRSQTVPDRLCNKYLVQKRHRLPEPNSPRPLHKGKKISRSKPHQAPGAKQTVPDRSQGNIYSNKTPAPRAERSRTVYTNKYLVQKITPAHRAERSRTVYTKAFARDKDKTKDGIKRNKGPGVGPATTE